ncbi:hypothetical protein [Virgisporangium aurantiacum]|uniref:Lipoprotein n=1 Tax=Virgisporangium aurantiacum TaxID=175570 RepID=A0A8J3Z798_9ACTN|nr:hypothetical protein [Virgisporangium aurantiacum]GIJ58789.1 hypothetical protein Vau01_063050 [Virgisporangium aurantiacum]
MPSPRRSVIVAVLVLLAGLGFAGCGRAQPGVAFYIGDTRYTEKQLDEMVDEIVAAVPGVDAADLRASAVNALVLRDLGRRVAEEKSVTVPAADYARTAQQLRMPENAELTRVTAEYTAVAGALVETTGPVQVTDKDIKGIYDVLLEAAGDQQLKPYDEVANILRSDPVLPKVLGVRDLLVVHADKVGVEVNPRYLPLTVALGEVPVPLTDGIGTVVDES